LSDFDEIESEQSYPCGKWFLPQPHRYWVWLEQGDTVSAIQVQMLVTGIGSRGSRNTYSMVPAGSVSSAERLADDRAARFINLRTEYRAFQRSERGSSATAAMRIPTGRIAGGVFDRESGDLVAFFRPFDLGAGQRVSATRLKQSDAGVFVVLKSPQMPRKRVHLMLHVDGRSVPPDDIVDGGIRTYAFWYAVKGTSARLEVINDAVTYEGPDLILRPGAVTTRRDDMKPKSAP
jgi:hypothetical protein